MVKDIFIGKASGVQDTPETLKVYGMPFDTGLAPNPYGGIMTLALCKPKLRGPAMAIGGKEWIIGMGPARAYLPDGRVEDWRDRVVHVMIPDERMTYDQYFHDPRFKDIKRPDSHSHPGDAIYFEGDEGYAIVPVFNDVHKADANGQLSSVFYAKDISAPWVIAADLKKHAWYFGGNAPKLPEQFLGTRLLTCGRRGHSNISNPDLIGAFKDWLISTYTPGVHGRPRQENLLKTYRYPRDFLPSFEAA